MKKYMYIFTILLFLFSLSVEIFSQDHSFVLGFNGIYRENSWTPLIIRIFNDGKSITGDLVVETNNSSTATVQKRIYKKPLDLPSGSQKEIFFTIPIGYHNRDIRYYFIAQDSIVFENIIPLKQQGVRSNLILGVSPYPDLGFLSNHPQLASRTICYPHIDNLPVNDSAYDAVDIISMHREMMDKLNTNQFKAISGWVNKGGILVVWGGKSPSPAKWDYLPSEIGSLKKISVPDFSSESILVNNIKTPSENEVYSFNGYELASRRTVGDGMVYFVAFDYSGAVINVPGVNKVWNIIFNNPQRTDSFSYWMNDDYLLERYISIFDNSGFTYLNRLNVALILFLSASASVSMLIFIRFRRKSSYINIYVYSLMFFLLILSISIYFSLNSNRVRTDCFLVSSNIIYQKRNSEQSRLYKDILIGSSSKTVSDIFMDGDTKSIIKLQDMENLTIEEAPEIHLKNIELDRWSSKIFRFERNIENILIVQKVNSQSGISINIKNVSDSFIYNSFLYFDGAYQYISNIMPGESISVSLSEKSENETYKNSNKLAETVVNQYISGLIGKDKIILGGFITEEIYPLGFSNRTWRKKTVNLILATEQFEGGSDE